MNIAIMKLITFKSLLCFFIAYSSALSVQAQDKEAGKNKANVCATCHGIDGISTLPVAPHLAGQPESYVKDQLKAYRDGKRVNDMMSLLAKPLSDKDIDDLAAWYSSIKINATLPK